MRDLELQPKERHFITLENVYAKRETERALLCVIEGGAHWIPKTQIGVDSEVQQRGDRGDLIITEWIGLEKGLF